MKAHIAQLYLDLPDSQKQSLFIVLAVISLFILIIGVRAWIKMFSTKEIAKAQWDELPIDLEITNRGFYSVFLHGKLFQSYKIDWKPILTHKDSLNTLIGRRTLFGIHTTGFANAKIELFGFNIRKNGVYTLSLTCGTVSALDQYNNELVGIIENLKKYNKKTETYLSVRNSPSLMQKAILFPQLLFVFIGLMGIIVGLILAINPQAFYK